MLTESRLARIRELAQGMEHEQGCSSNFPDRGNKCTYYPLGKCDCAFGKILAEAGGGE